MHVAKAGGALLMRVARRTSVRTLVACAVAIGSGACKLQEVTLATATDVVIAEVYVELNPDEGGPGDRVTAFLHRTLEGGTGASRPVEGARVEIIRSDGFSLELAETDLERCVTSTPVDGTGTCFWAAPALADRLQPGDRLELRIDLAGGGVLRSAATVPGAFALLNAPSGVCGVPPLTPFDVVWTQSAGSWAYIAETLVGGVRAAYEPQGITVKNDPLYLLGLAISASDTTITFPGQFGIFDRFELDQALSLALQKGLPTETAAHVAITAGDRNYVNWVRGGSFNPSGQVKIPSVRGDGTGVFAATVTRAMEVLVDGLTTKIGIRCSER